MNHRPACHLLDGVQDCVNENHVSLNVNKSYVQTWWLALYYCTHTETHTLITDTSPSWTLQWYRSSCNATFNADRIRGYFRMRAHGMVNANGWIRCRPPSGSTILSCTNWTNKRAESLTRQFLGPDIGWLKLGCWIMLPSHFCQTPTSPSRSGNWAINGTSQTGLTSSPGCRSLVWVNQIWYLCLGRQRAYLSNQKKSEWNLCIFSLRSAAKRASGIPGILAYLSPNQHIKSARPPESPCRIFSGVKSGEWPFQHWGAAAVGEVNSGSSAYKAGQHRIGWHNWCSGEPNSGSSSYCNSFAAGRLSRSNYCWFVFTGSDLRSCQVYVL